MDELIERLPELRVKFEKRFMTSAVDEYCPEEFGELLDAVEAQAARIGVLQEENRRLRRCLLPVQMTLAQAECVDEPIPDDAVVLHFMGSGASDQVTAGEVRAALQPEGGALSLNPTNVPQFTK